MAEVLKPGLAVIIGEDNTLPPTNSAATNLTSLAATID